MAGRCGLAQKRAKARHLAVGWEGALAREHLAVQGHDATVRLGKVVDDRAVRGGEAKTRLGLAVGGSVCTHARGSWYPWTATWLSRARSTGSSSPWHGAAARGRWRLRETWRRVRLLHGKGIGQGILGTSIGRFIDGGELVGSRREDRKGQRHLPAWSTETGAAL
ncbi:hypothetical protein C2845_PM18G06780 [Panicum miliaceum]|uniref:Uncharacterized protein n=1 Tax=Panicum miliaceum TaxID=4540 RepID=A0A3L6PMS5_PANMI|nr:hypothetical protein C2845_PM18G06780 [Panicum miliaceum]